MLSLRASPHLLPPSLQQTSCTRNPLVAISTLVGSAHPERGKKKTNVGLRMILGKMHIEEKIELKKFD
jgi:hypothetical protein